MKRPANYHTRQRESILAYIVSLQGEHITASQIVTHFAAQDVSIGRTTVYRHLNQLTESGKLRRYTIDGSASGACYQYTGSEDSEHCCTHLHLKCEGCGELLHLECHSLHALEKHVRDEHAFEINATKTFLYGRCNDCISLGRTSNT